MKILRKIRLINWHRFENETIELSKSVLLSGENGAGKSTILDAVQFAMTGSKAHFNKAAHEKGKRNLNSYIRCKTGREDRPFERTGALSAHIALEFFEEAKNKSFLIGVVMDSSSEEKEPGTAWYLMENRVLRDDYFFKGKQVRSISSFRANKDIRIWAPTIAEARKMMLSRFGRIEDKFFSLIPKALAFKPIHDIKDFVYSYVLDEKEVNIDALRENVRSYQELERMLADVRKKIDELEKIADKEQEVQNCTRRDRNQEYFITRAQEDLTGQRIRAVRGKIRSEEHRLREMEQKRLSLEKERDRKELMIRDLSVELQSDSEYQAFRELERRETDLKQLLKEDRIEVQKLLSSAKKAYENAQELLRGGTQEDSVNSVAQYAEIVRAVRDCESIAVAADLCEKVIAYKNDQYEKLQTQLAELRVMLRRKHQQMEELQGRIRQLESRKLVYKPEVVELQRRIREQFKRAGRKSDARILCELLEIRDPKWQNAVEGYLNTQRFYLVVEPEDFDLALSVYDRARSQKKVYGVGLINTAKLEAYDEAPPGSLAEHVSSGNLWARRYVNMVLGRVHCCDSWQELKKFPVSITARCMRYQNHVVSAIPPDVYRTPYIGSGAYKVQLEQCRAQREQMQSEIGEEENRERDLRDSLIPLSTDADVDVKYRLTALESQRAHETEIENCKKEMRKLEASKTLLLKKIRVEQMQGEKRLIEEQLAGTDREIGSLQQKIGSLKEEVLSAQELAKEQERVSEELALKLGKDKEACEDDYKKQSAGKELSRFIENYERARKANQTVRETAQSAMSALMRAYKTAHDFGAADTLEAFDEYRREYEKLKNSQLLEYEDKVYRARTAAEEEFREQFLSRLQENIREAQNEFKELNKALRDIRFSREQYEFRHEPRKNLRKFYDMIMDDFNVLQGASIFSGLFSETHKEVIEELFDKLTLDDESSARTLQEYTDYRTYMDYDIKITLDDGSFMFYSKVSREKSGGETQTPFYITVAASFMQLYRGSIGGDSIGLIMMDEAFNNMDDERIAGVLSFMTHSNLQTIIAAPPDKIQYIGPAVDRVLLVMQDEKVSYVEEFFRSST